MGATLGTIKQVAADKEAQLELRINVGSTAKNGDPVTFSIHKALDDSQLDTVDGTITKGKAVGTWKAKGPEPEGDVRAWRVYYKVTIGIEEAVSPELEVYLDSLEITSQDEEGASLADAGFTVFVGKTDPTGKQATTGSSGTYKVTGLPPGELRLVWKAPIRQVGDLVVDGAGKKTAKLKKSFKAELVSPKKGTHDQWVNLAPDKKSPERGSALVVRARPVAADGPSRKGDVFYVKVTWPEATKLSERSDPARAFAGATKTAWSGDGVGKAITIAADGADCVFTLELGYAGADTVKVEVGGTDTVDDEAVVDVTNRRKIYYQISHRDGQTLPVITSIGAELEKVGVRYEGDPVKAFKDSLPGVPPGSYFDGGDVGFPGQRLLAVGNHNRTWFHANLWKDERKPVGVHILLCDLQMDAGVRTALVEPQDVLLDTATGTLEFDNIPFRTSLFDGKSPLVDGKWISQAPAGHADHLKEGPIGLTDLVFRTIEGKVDVTLPAPAANLVGDGSGAKHPVQVRVTLNVSKGPYKGDASGARHIISTKSPDGAWTKAVARTDLDMCQTMTHELGHTMKQVVHATGAPPGLDGSKHGRQYEYLGSHCADQMPQTDYDALVAGKQPKWLDGTCVMFAPDGGKRTNAFCDRCKPFILAERLSTL